MHAQLTAQNASFIELQSGSTYFFFIPKALQINFNLSRKNSVTSCRFLWNQGKDFHYVANTPGLWWAHSSNATQNCFYWTHEQPLWTDMCDWYVWCVQEILYPPHWDSYSPEIKSSWGKGWADWEGSIERLQKESALQGCAEPPARAGSRPVPVWRNKATKK